MIEIRKLKSLDEFKQIPEIEKNAWEFSDYDNEPHHLMTRVHKYGGLIQGLFMDHKMIGFSYALLGKWEGKYFIYSHMLAVVKEHQSKGYGFLLKKAQRQELMDRGYDLVRWNFDPLESLNSYFNIYRLGVISSEYERNIYGVGESGLHQGLPTDRLIATWHLRSKRVAEKMGKKNPPLCENVPREKLENFTQDTAYIEIPRDIRQLRASHIKQAQKWRLDTREFFEYAFQNSFIVENIVFSENKERVFIRLQRGSHNLE